MKNGICSMLCLNRQFIELDDRQERAAAAEGCYNGYTESQFTHRHFSTH